MTDRVLVYGTLREGCHNAYLWSELGSADGAWLEGYRLYKVAGAAFPIVLPTGDMADRVRVDVITWHSADDARTGLERLDWLEGAPEFYERVRGSARLLGTSDAVSGWVYVPKEPRLRHGAWLIESGDWKVYTGVTDFTHKSVR